MTTKSDATTAVSSNAEPLPLTLPHTHSHLQSEPLYRFTTLFRALPTISESQFYNHWYGHHALLVIPWALHHNIVEYTQYHTSTDHRQALSAGKSGYFNKGSPFAACADIYAKDPQQYFAAFRDPFYLEVIAKDEQLFIDKNAKDDETRWISLSTMGINRSVIKDGKAMLEVPKEILEIWDEYQKKKAAK